jgi:hypothetical protein
MKSGLLGDLWSYLAFALMLVGITGLSWELFREDGWAKSFLGAVWDAEIRNPLIVTPVLIGTVFLVTLFFRGGLKVGKGNPFSDAFVYLLMAAGVYFAFKWLR